MTDVLDTIRLAADAGHAAWKEGYEDATGFHWGKEPSVSVQCAWCRRVMTAAPAGSPVTHTICPACSAKFFPETTHETQPAKSHV